jgi:hypothetical protein
MKFQIDFNATDYYNDKFLINRLGAKVVPTGSDKYLPFEVLEIEVKDFNHLEELLVIVDKEFKDIYSAVISFDPPTLYLDNKI